MKNNTKNPTTFLNSCKRFFGAMLVVALMVPAVTFSQHSNPATINLGSAGNFTVLAGSAITIGASCTVTGDIGESPGSTLTNGGSFTGVSHLGDSTALIAQNDLTAAYDTVRLGRPADSTCASGDIGGATLTRGVYLSGPASLAITGTLTLYGSASDIFIFKSTGSLTTYAGTHVTLTGGVLASNVFWYVESSATIDGDFKGNILALTAITQNVGASSVITGRALARNGAVTVNGTSVLQTEVVAVIDTNTITRWRMQLTASIGIAQDNENYLGVADSATDGLDPFFDTPEAPAAPGNYVSLYFPHPEWGSLLGDNFARDIKKNTVLADTVKRWYFQVKSNVLNDTVTLSFINDRIPSAISKYLTDMKSGTRINLRNSSLYKYYNTSDAAHLFMIVVGDSSSTPPSLALITPNGGNIWRSGTSKNIVWSTSDETGIDSIFVYSSSNGGSSYALIRALGYTQSTNWTVPNEYLNNNYSIKIISRDSLGNQTSVRSANTFTVVGDSLATSSATGWSLVSLPLQPSDSTAGAILGDDFINSPYYLWAYNQSSGYVLPTILQFGRGYWLGVISTSAWDVRGAAVEVDSIIIDLPFGYTIIGSNFVRNVPKQGISFKKSGVTYSFSDAVTQGILVNAIYGYDGTSYDVIDTLQMFKGYWLGILQNGVQMIQKPVVSNVAPLMNIARPMQSTWDLSIVASSSTQTDHFAKIGVRPNATNDFDVLFDLPKPPHSPKNNYIELYFPHSGQRYPAILGSKYAYDYRGTENPQWSFIVETTDSGQVNLQWDNTFLNQLSNSVQLTLTDVATSTSIDMSKQNSYVFTYSVPRSFNIASQTKVTEHQDIPSSYALSQNYPNPFNPSTKIEYKIAKAGMVSLKVYNVLGLEVATLVNDNQEAGSYTVSFNTNKGTLGLSSGVYFYRLESGSFVSTKKLIFMK